MSDNAAGSSEKYNNTGFLAERKRCISSTVPDELSLVGEPSRFPKMAMHTSPVATSCRLMASWPPDTPSCGVASFSQRTGLSTSWRALELSEFQARRTVSTAARSSATSPGDATKTSSTLASNIGYCATVAVYAGELGAPEPGFVTTMLNAVPACKFDGSVTTSVCASTNCVSCATPLIVAVAPWAKPLPASVTFVEAVVTALGAVAVMTGAAPVNLSASAASCSLLNSSVNTS